jgi:hypothetical protein
MINRIFEALYEALFMDLCHLALSTVFDGDRRGVSHTPLLTMLPLLSIFIGVLS